MSLAISEALRCLWYMHLVMQEHYRDRLGKLTLFGAARRCQYVGLSSHAQHGLQVGVRAQCNQGSTKMAAGPLSDNKT